MVLRLNTGKDIDSFLLNFNRILVSQFAQVALHLLVKLGELLIEIFLLAKASLVHTDLVLLLVEFKLVLVCLPPNLLVALFPQLFELSLLVVLQVVDNFSGLVQL